MFEYCIRASMPCSTFFKLGFSGRHLVLRRFACWAFLLPGASYLSDNRRCKFLSAGFADMNASLLFSGGAVSKAAQATCSSEFQSSWLWMVFLIGTSLLIY